MQRTGSSSLSARTEAALASDADAGTIRADHADSIDENAVHGSDSPETAAVEIAYFFSTTELCPRTR